MGLGLLGRGVGDVAFLAECGADVLVTDLKTEAELAGSLLQLKEHNITYVFGEHRREDFESRDLILVAAGVPLDSPYLEHARAKGVHYTQSAALFSKLSGVPLIGVTGTRGKSTVTHMIHHVLTRATEGASVLLGGNVRGVSNLQLLKEAEEGSLAVFELDSWQLQGFGWEKISPQVAVFTTFMPDHLNYYKGDEDAYFADKANIFLYQEDHGVLVTTPALLERIEKFAASKGLTLQQEIALADSSTLPADYELLVPGEHNRLNAALAHKALLATGLSDEEVLVHLNTFPGLPGRLEFLGEYSGVKIYNDNNATTPAATLAALQALGKENKKNLVLIMGGADKAIDMNELAVAIPQYAKHVTLLPGTGTDRVKSMIKGTEVSSVMDALQDAYAHTEEGDSIVFSPAFASFGLFKNEYDRNDQFVEAVKKYAYA